MKRPRTSLITAILLVALAADLRGDFLIYKIPLDSSQYRQGNPGGAQRGGPPRGGPPAGAPGAPPGMAPPGGYPGAGGAAPSELKIVLPGRVQVNPGKTVSYFHPTIREPLYFRLDDVEIKKAATPQQEYNKLVAAAGKEPDALMSAAIWALKKGLLREFYTAVDKALDANPRHEAATRVKELKKKIDEPLPDNPALEKELRGYIKASSGMRVAKSNHFILLYDTPEKAPKGKRKNRAQERLELLEQVYESFLLLFHAQDVELDIPADRLKVVLFNDYKDYLDFATSRSPTLSSASGFWEHISNTSVFFDHGTSESHKALEKLQDALHEQADEARKNRNNPDLIRFVKTIDLLIEVDRENSDITVVSHEATHQMAGNTGLLPRHVAIPSWVHEGLATYFEAPGDATWAGIGAVNEQRLEFYRALEKDRLHSNIDFIVGDQIFDFAGNLGAKLHGYGQAWALTHFLLEKHLKEFVAYYRMLGEMPPDVTLNPALLTELFNRSFGSDHEALNQEWRHYMRTLKTDLERLEDSGGKRS